VLHILRCLRSAWAIFIALSSGQLFSCDAKVNAVARWQGANEDFSPCSCPSL
jgi:hypothetical protein